MNRHEVEELAEDICVAINSAEAKKKGIDYDKLFHTIIDILESYIVIDHEDSEIDCDI